MILTHGAIELGVFSLSGQCLYVEISWVVVGGTGEAFVGEEGGGVGPGPVVSHVSVVEQHQAEVGTC